MKFKSQKTNQNYCNTNETKYFMHVYTKLRIHYTQLFNAIGIPKRKNYKCICYNIPEYKKYTTAQDVPKLSSTVCWQSASQYLSQ